MYAGAATRGLLLGYDELAGYRSPTQWARRQTYGTRLRASPHILIRVVRNVTPDALPLLGLAVGPLAVFALCLLVGATAVGLVGRSSRWLGRRLAARARRPAVLIAAERLRDDPWAAARTHAAVLLVTVVGTGFVGVREVLLAELRVSRREGHLGMSLSYYTDGIDPTAAAILVAW